MTNTVGLISCTGVIGSSLFDALRAAESKGSLKLVVLTRPTSKAVIPKGIEHRHLDVAKSTPTEVTAALKGVDILIDASMGIPLDAGLRFMEALAALPTPLKVFIPSDFAFNYTDKDVIKSDNVVITRKLALIDKARSLGLPLTPIRIGMLEPFFWNPHASGVDIEANTLSLYGDAANTKVPITGLKYLGEAVASLVTKPPSQIANRSYTIIETEVTGEEVAEALAARNGTKATITKFTDAEAGQLSAIPVLGPIAVAFRKKWGVGEWPQDDRYDPEGVRPRTIDEMVKGAGTESHLLEGWGQAF